MVMAFVLMSLLRLWTDICQILTIEILFLVKLTGSSIFLILTLEYVFFQTRFCKTSVIDKWYTTLFLQRQFFWAKSASDLGIWIFEESLNFYLFKANKKTGKRCEICSKLTIMIPERQIPTFKLNMEGGMRK